MLRARLAPVLALLALALALLAPRPARAEPGDELTVYVITFGPGDHPFYKFGHDAIWIHNAAAPPVVTTKRDPIQTVQEDLKRQCRGLSNQIRRDPVYNWGTFAFGDPALIPKFITGRFQYWLSKAPICMTVALYQQENRSVIAQELNLTAAQKKALYDAVEENAKEENKHYKYDYYRDNCATRVRDMIDKVLGGKLQAASQAPASMTWRAHTLRLTADDKVLSLALSVVMSSVIDQPINQWQEMFLPAYVEEGLRRVKVPGPDGAEIPLVKSEVKLATDEGRPPLRTAPPPWGIWMLLAGLAFGGGLFAAGLFAKRSLPARIALGALLFTAGALCILSLLFLFAWTGTDHEVGYHNENILQLFPPCLALMGFCFGAARLKPKSIARAKAVVTWAAAASAFGLVWKVLPWMRQDNYWFIAFCLPVWAGAVMGLRALEGSLKGAAPSEKAGPAKAPSPRKKGEKDDAIPDADDEAIAPAGSVDRNAAAKDEPSDKGEGEAKEPDEAPGDDAEKG